MLIRILLFIIISISAVAANADELKDCERSNSNNIPCLTIRSSIPNSNIVSNKISPTAIITKEQIEKFNLIDLPKVLNFINGVQITQSGPMGQQTSVFMRGSNSNHTLVLLNGIPINDQSTINGGYDFGQDFMSNVNQVEVYKGTAGAHFGADSIGGAINLVTTIDYTNKMLITGYNDSKTIQGNYTKIINDWNINFQGGVHKSKTESALSRGTDKDGAENKSLGLNIVKWFSDHLIFRTNIFARNTFADLDGHSLSLQDGYDSNNELIAFQTGFDFITEDSKNYITLHKHAYERDYNSPSGELDEYDADSYLIRAERSKKLSNKFSYGLGLEHKYDVSTFTNRGSYNSSLSGDYDNAAFYGNASYKFFNNLSGSINVRTDNNSVVGKNDSYKIGFLKENIFPKLNARLNFASGFKNPSLYELYGADSYGYKGNTSLTAEISKTNEIGFDYNFNTNSMLTLSLFKNNISDLIEYSDLTYNNTSNKIKQSGIELAYGLHNDVNQLTISGSSLSSEKTDGSAQLRRPEWNLDINYDRILFDGFNFITNYKFKGKHFDIHNSNYSTITMPDIHLLNLGITKNYWGYEIGATTNNFLDENYESPHGFSQNSRSLNFFLKRKY
jgi:vitamin B12 transporter